MKVVYIAGPFRADNTWAIEQHVRRAEELSIQLWREGVPVICPHTNTRYFHGAAPDDVWLRGYIEILRRCDALLTVDGYGNSSGAMAEITEARTVGIKVFHDVGACLDFCFERGLHKDAKEADHA